MAEYRKLRLRELDDFYIRLSCADILVSEQLKRLPRTGKAVRLEKMPFEIKARSVYDHICSLFDIATVLLPYFPKIVAEDVSYFITYHDVNEILIGDVPEYTSAFPSRYERSWEILKQTPKDKCDRIANDFLSLFADRPQKKGLGILRAAPRKEKEFFYVLDTIDPIFAVWRYCYHYRGRIDGVAFVNGMEDFFTYPNLHRVIDECSVADFRDLLQVLVTPQYAIDYCAGRPIEEMCANPRSRDIFKYLTEQTPLFH